MICKICGSTSNKIFTTELLKKYPVSYYECPTCHFIQTEPPYWLDEAYASPINETDTGLLARNLQFLPLVSSLLLYLVGKDGKFVDYGGGYGVFTRLMRDVGFDYYWTDPMCKNIHANGFEWDRTMKPDAITLFETFEHFVDPRDEIKKLMEISKTIVFSTTTAPVPYPQPESWWYYGLEHGQHVALYRPKTFRHIAQEEHMHYTNFGNIHVFSEKQIPKEGAFLLRKASKLAFPAIKRMMISRTYSDMQHIINRNK